MTEEERQRLVAAGFDKFKQAVDSATPKAERSEFDELIGKLILAGQDVKEQLKPVVAAGGGRDPRAMEKLVFDLYAHKFHSFAKVELEQIVAWMLTSTVMQSMYPKELGVKPTL